MTCLNMLTWCADFSVWEIFSDAIFTANQDWETDIVTFSHPTIDRFYDLGNRWCAFQKIDRNAWRKKVQDAVRYFTAGISHEVSALDFRFSRYSFLQTARNRFYLATRWSICCSIWSGRSRGWKHGCEKMKAKKKVYVERRRRNGCCCK